MTKPRPKSKAPASRGTSAVKKSPSKRFGRSTTKPSGKPAAKKPGKNPDKSPSKSVNPFGEKKRPAGKKSFGAKGLKGFKKRRDDENLDIQLTDKELGEVTVIKRKLAEIREYKRILAEDGLKPDQQDKERESALIVRLLRIEKNAKMAARQRAKAAKTEAFREAAEMAEFSKQKKKSRADRFSDEDGDDDYRGKSFEDDDSDDDYRPRKRHDYDDDY